MGVSAAGWNATLAWGPERKRDPAKLASAVLEAYAKEWWHSTNTCEHSAVGVLPPRVLREAFERANASTDPNASWNSQARGPISTMVLWLKYVGWNLLSPTRFEDPRLNKDYDLCWGSPKRIGEIFVDALRAKWEREAVESLST